MAQRAFVKVVGFSAVERHALNTTFRLSEERQAPYALWMPSAAEPPALLLVDGQSPEAAGQLEAAQATGAKVIWIGPNAPAPAWRAFERPIAWPRVIEAIDALFTPQPAGSAAAPAAASGAAPAAADSDIDFDLGDTDAMDTQPPDTQPSPDHEAPPRALIASADHDQRLYLRARLALAGLTFVDDAESAGHALELAKRLTYGVAIVEHHPPELDAWFLLKRLRELGADRPAVIVTDARASLVDRLRARMGGAAAFLVTPPDPATLEAALRKVIAQEKLLPPALALQQAG